MIARVFALDPLALRSATKATGLVRQTIDHSPDEVLERIIRPAPSAGLRRALVIAQVEDYVASVITAVHSVVSNASFGHEDDPTDQVASFGFGHIRLTLLRGDDPVRINAILGADQCEFLCDNGIDLGQVFSSLGMRALPLRLVTSEAITNGESTLAIAGSLLAAIPRELIELAFLGRRSNSSDTRLLGRRFYQHLFPGRRIGLGEDLLWRDAVILASRAVMGFEEWRMTLASYQSSACYRDVIRILFERTQPSSAVDFDSGLVTN